MKHSLPGNFFTEHATVSKNSVPLFASIIFSFLLLTFSSNNALASHFKGGQITYNYLGEGRYEVLVKSYWDKTEVGFIFPRYEGSPVKHNFFPGTVSKTLLADGETIEHVQKQEISWSVPGVYKIYWTSCCARSVGSNFDNNDAGFFATVSYDPDSPSSSPEFFDPFILNFKAEQAIEYNINAGDPEHHEQVYSLEIPYGLPANAYDQMLETGFQVTNDGTIQWENPQMGIWLINIKMREKIDGIYTGAYIEKDYFLNIGDFGGNMPPEFTLVNDQSVKVGELLSFEIEASDAKEQELTLTANGLPFGDGATFIQTKVDSLAKGTFEWTPDAVGTYTVQFVASDNHSPSLSAYREINIVVALCIEYNTGYTIMAQPCEGLTNGSISLTGPQGINPYSYSLNNGASFQDMPDFENLGPGTYIGVIKDAIGCLSEPVSIELEEVPLPEVSVDLPAYICANAAPLQLNGGYPVGGSWQGTGVSNGLFYSDQAGIGTHTIYYIYTNSNGCSNTASQELTVYDAPLADITTDDTVVYIVKGNSAGAGSCTLLAGSATMGASPYAFLWSTGETTQSIDVCPTETTTYIFTVTDAYGCSDASEITVTVVDRVGGGAAATPEHAKNKYGSGNNPGSNRSDNENARTVEKTEFFMNEEASANNTAGIVVFPNPITDESQVKVMSAYDDQIIVDIIDRSGHIVKNLYTGRITGQQELSFEMGSKTSKNEIYFCRLITTKEVIILKLMR